MEMEGIFDLSILAGTSAIIADDEGKIRELLRMELEEHSVKVYEAQNCREALEIMDHTKIDFIISDIRMPRGSGIEFLDELAKIREGRPMIFMMTGFSDLSPHKARELGAIELISKPFDIKKTIEIIVKSLRR